MARRVCKGTPRRCATRGGGSCARCSGKSEFSSLCAADKEPIREYANGYREGEEEEGGGGRREEEEEEVESERGCRRAGAG